MVCAEGMVSEREGVAEAGQHLAAVCGPDAARSICTIACTLICVSAWFLGYLACILRWG